MPVVQLPGPKVTGPVTVEAQTNGTVYVRTGENAHINDDRPTVVFRGKEWIGSTWFVQDESGAWVEKAVQGFTPEFTDRAEMDWRKKAAPTFRQAIVDAMAAVIADVVQPSDFITKDFEAYQQELARAEKELAEAQAKVADVKARWDAKLHAHTAKLP